MSAMALLPSWIPKAAPPSRTAPTIGQAKGFDIARRTKRRKPRSKRRGGRSGKRFRRLQNLFGMARYLHLAPDAGDRAVPVDQEGSAVDPHIFAAVHRFFDPGAERLADRAVA